jgi:3-methyladenine DNA glycosylase AlkD
MASLAVHDKYAPDKEFTQFLPIIVREANDSRNFVKKAVNRALRGSGKRNRALNQRAIKTAEKLENSKSKVEGGLGKMLNANSAIRRYNDF